MMKKIGLIGILAVIVFITVCPHSAGAEGWCNLKEYYSGSEPTNPSDGRGNGQRDGSGNVVFGDTIDGPIGGVEPFF
jgi:hypothetical protein